MAGDQVAERVVAHVPLVRRPARVRVHAQAVEARPRVVVVDLIRPALSPVVLPLLLDRLNVVGRSHGSMLIAAIRFRPGPGARSPRPNGRASTDCYERF